ncbi:MAG: hypothetical protein R2710_21795 [Acidimicrobiales bacterium]
MMRIVGMLGDESVLVVTLDALAAFAMGTVAGSVMTVGLLRHRQLVSEYRTLIEAGVQQSIDELLMAYAEYSDSPLQAPTS